MGTWTRITETGSGTVDFRLQVEGWPHEWVTNPRITHATNKAGRTVYAGLSYKGMRISERCDLKTAWPNAIGMTVTIVPVDLAESTMMFTRDPQQVGFLFATIDADDTTWSTKPSPLPAGVYHLGSEAVSHNGSNTITRAVWNTGGQIHSVLDASVDNPVPIYSWPPTMEGRRANLYAYGDGDVGSGDGTIIWRGIVARPPRVERDGVSWTIALDPITKVFEQNVGGDESREYKIRGIYHSNECPMALTAGVGADSIGGQDIGLVYMSGFFENDADWINYVNTQVASMIGSPATDVAALVFGMFDGKPGIEVVYSSSVFATVIIKDALDGDMPWTSQGNGRTFNSIKNMISSGNSAGELVVTGATIQPPYGYPLPNARCMVGSPVFDSPGSYGFWGFKPWDDIVDLDYPGPPDGSWPSNRVYLQSVDDLAIGMVLAAREGDAEVASFLEITDVDTTDRWIEVSVRSSASGGPVYLSSDTALIPVGNFGTLTDWSGFMFEVVSQAPAANLGRTPYITSEDVENSAWSALWVTHPFNDYWRNRNYQFLKPAKVRDVLAPEFMATGYMGRLNLDGKLDVAPLPVVSPQATPLFTIDDNEILLPAEGMFGMFPTWESQRDGLVNIVKLRLGYNPVTDDYEEAKDFTIRQVNSIAEHKSGNRASTEIAPRSAATASTPASEVVAGFVDPYLRTLSEDYAIVTVAVPFSLFEVLCGDLCEITSAFIPDGHGKRGITKKKCICIGREWNLDPASNEMGKLTFWFPRDSGKRAGYAPTGRITGQSNTSGNIWVLTFSVLNSRNIDWAEGTDGNVVKHFAVNDPIQIVLVDSNSPTIRTGVVTAIPASNQITVSLDSSWTPSTSTWNLRFWTPLLADPRFNNIFAHSFFYCWVADSNQQLADGTLARSFV